jgi:hypothetical protein
MFEGMAEVWVIGKVSEKSSITGVDIRLLTRLTT